MATGAYGRGEANNWSGIDLICIKGGAPEETNRPSYTDVDIALINILDQLNLPRILPHVHYLNNILDTGNPGNDQNVSFLTRIPMLTEGAPVYNTNFYESSLRCVISSYCTDYYQYTIGATPAYIIADITRYWKTIQLKNLHNRKAYIHDWWGHVVNLKLIFSTKLACYSFIFLLLVRGPLLTESYLFSIARMKPLERMYRLMQEAPATQTIAADIINHYCDILTLHNQSIESLKEYFKSESNRKEMYNSGEVRFSQRIYDMLLLLTNTDISLLRYLII
jgi:hypothetical protein